MLALLVSAAASASAPSFPTRVTYPTGARAVAVAVGDVTGDGIPDAVLTTSLGGDAAYADRTASLVVYPGRGDGSFGSPTLLPTHDPKAQTEVESQRTVALADLNGDGRLDAATVTPAGVDLYLQANGRLSPATLIPQTAGADNVAAADMNGDGRPDLIVELADPSTQTASIDLLTNTGGGDFSSRTIWTGQLRLWNAAVGDLNGDGRDDLVLTGDRGGVLFTALIQESDGTFAATDYPGASGVCCATLGLADVTGDGRLDVTVGANGGEVTYPGDGGGGFGQPFQTSATDGPSTFVGADVNGDGQTDLVVASSSSPQNDEGVELFLQQSHRLESPITLFMPDFAGSYESSESVAVADLNGDGAPDILAVDPNTGLVVFQQAATAGSGTSAAGTTTTATTTTAGTTTAATATTSVTTTTASTPPPPSTTSAGTTIAPTTTTQQRTTTTTAAKPRKRQPRRSTVHTASGRLVLRLAGTGRATVVVAGRALEYRQGSAVWSARVRVTPEPQRVLLVGATTLHGRTTAVAVVVALRSRTISVKVGQSRRGGVIVRGRLLVR